MMTIKELPNSDLTRIAEIDRSEGVVTLGYEVRDGQLISQEVHWPTPTWFEGDEHEHSIGMQIRNWSPILDEGGVFLGALDGEKLAGFAILRYRLEEDMAQMAALYVSRPYRRQGIASNLMSEVIRLAKADGATCLYISATPSQSAVGFYLSQGCQLAQHVNKTLYDLEPEDIHMIKIL